jgi:CBS domain containing-hemolysin-like protein
MTADDNGSRRENGGAIAGLMRLLGLRDAARDETEQAEHEHVDMVDQAEAFQSLRVSDVMTPRADVVALELSAPFKEVVGQFAETEHSRLPLYRETLDEPVGVVHIKDVFKLLTPRGEMQPPEWDEQVLRRLRREVLYVPASMRAADLLLRMQAKHIHMALVIDEFGGTDGLVSMEDLIEAVVGDIADEHDEAEPEVIARGPDLYEADARAPLEDLEEALSAELTPQDLEEEIETVGGLVSALAGRVPQRGEVIPHPSGYELEVMDADPRRVKRVRIRKLPPAPPAQDETARG